jgi:hypothetical protein
MTHKLTMVATAVALALGAATAQAASVADMVSVRGFGTAGVVHSSTDLADVTGSVFQPDGAGFTRDYDLRTLSKLAGQMNVQFMDQLSLTAQVITQYQYDRSYKPQIEWLNLKYSFTPNLSARIGRIALPTFMVSDSRMVGYANPWVRPPEELYQLGSITSNDGVDVSYSFTSGSLKNSFQAFYGQSEADISSGVADANAIYGLNYLAEVGSASFRVGYIRMDLDLEIDTVGQMFDGLRGLGAALNGFGFTTQGAQAFALADKYTLEDMNLSFLSVGATYDPGKWFVTGEVLDFGGDTMLSDAFGGYVTGGMRFGKFTPYATFASVDADIENEPGISTTGLPGVFAGGAAALNAGLNTSINQFQGSQQSVGVGMRWDAFNNVAIKGQYNRVNLGDNSSGKLANVQPGFELGSTYSVYTLTVDFIF